MPAESRRSAQSCLTKSAPISVGAGCLTLDSLLIGKDRVNANRRYAGGSCGNVLAILAHLDWNSYPVARLGTDRCTQLLIEDLKSFRVNTSFVAKEDAGVTPVIILRLAQDKTGAYRSRFEWRNPRSGDWLPRYRPCRNPSRHASVRIYLTQRFYFDRAEPSSLMLASAMREKGAVVFFEPSSSRDDILFTNCLAVSDIVKYSAERIGTPPRNPNGTSPRLEIQTLGERGLRYRVKVGSSTTPGVGDIWRPFRWTVLRMQPAAVIGAVQVSWTDCARMVVTNLKLLGGVVFVGGLVLSGGFRRGCGGVGGPSYDPRFPFPSPFFFWG